MPLILDPQIQANTAQDIENYKSTIHAILSAMGDFGKQFEPKNEDLDFYDMQQYPEDWSSTTRAGATRIEGSLSKSAYATIHDQLKVKLKELTQKRVGRRLKQVMSRLSPEEENQAKEDDQNILQLQATLEKLEVLQQEEVALFLRRLRIKTAEKLLSQLDKALSSNHVYIPEINSKRNAFKLQVKALQELNNDEILTSRDALNITSRANGLSRNIAELDQLLRSYGSIPSLQEITATTTQLSVITKREMDPYYDHPKVMSLAQHRRIQARKYTSYAAVIFAAATLICMFIPGGQLAAVIFGALSGVALFSLADSLVEVGRNLYYGRAPTKAQVTELAIFIPLLAAIMFGAHALVPVATAIAGKSAAIIGTLSAVSTFIGTKFNAGFTILANALGGHMNRSILKAAQTPRVSASITTSTIPLVAGGKILKLKAKNDNQRREMVVQSVSLKKDFEKEPKKIVYLHVSDNGFKTVDSYHAALANWEGGFFAHEILKELHQLKEGYVKAKASCSITERQEKLDVLNARIKQIKQEEIMLSQVKSKMEELEELVKKELAQVNQIIEDSNPGDVFLVHTRHH